MARTDADTVRGLIESPLSDAQIESFISVATAVIDRYSARCSTASVTVLAHMETLLSAHFIYAARVNILTERKFGDSTEKYADSTKDGTDLTASIYGQQLKMLDPCGIITDMDKTQANTVLL